MKELTGATVCAAFPGASEEAPAAAAATCADAGARTSVMGPIGGSAFGRLGLGVDFDRTQPQSNMTKPTTHPRKVVFDPLTGHV